MNSDAMLPEGAHLSDEDLVMSADGELAAHRDAAVRAHLATCPPCQTRATQLETATTDLQRTYMRSADSEVPSIASPRAHLRARLAAQRGHSWWPRFALVAAGLSVVAFLGYRISRFAEFEPGVAPKRNLTPGATLAVTTSEVCSADFTQHLPGIPAAIQRKVFEAYGIVNPRPDAYEVDYLITPELGGATTIRNLWPEPYHAPIWNAHVKDDLEDRLHALVCRGELDLATAQHDIAANWISAYKKYFRSDRPVAGPVRDPRVILARF